MNLEAIQFLKTQRPITADNLDRVCDWIAAALAGDPGAWYRPFVREAVDVLCEIATDPAGRFGKVGQDTIFSVVERLSDSFDTAYVPIYDEVFAQIIDFCRRHPAGGDLDRMLNRFKIHNEKELLQRKNRLASRPIPAIRHESIRKILVLSRVTLGADVAVTSVIVRSLLTAFPNAEIVLAGPASIREVYQGVQRLRTLQVDYRKGRSLLDRLQSWVELVRAVDLERNALSQTEYLVVDPDSRLTQLGLLPVTENQESHFFFESRSYQHAGKNGLSQLAAQWSADCFGGDPGATSFIQLSADDQNWGNRCCRGLRSPKAAGLVAVNFGVGDNPKKRLSLEFETRLVFELLSQSYGVILDKGIGEEVVRANHIVNEARRAGKSVLELDRSMSANQSRLPSAEIATWEGRVGGFAGLVASSDLYVGYDSAFQHIAAALSVPVIDIFVQPARDTFVDRWTPNSKAAVRMIKTDAEASLSARKEIAIVSQILAAIPSLVVDRPE